MLSDAQWEAIAELLPSRTGRRGRPFSDTRAMIEGIIYRYRCGIAWRDLSEVFGPWQTVWTWHRLLAGDGTLGPSPRTSTDVADAAGMLDWAVSVDSTIVRMSALRNAEDPDDKFGIRNGFGDNEFGDVSTKRTSTFIRPRFNPLRPPTTGARRRADLRHPEQQNRRLPRISMKGPQEVPNPI